MPEKSDKKFSQKQKDKIIKGFTEDFDLAFTAESRNRIDMVDDLRFAALDQWPREVRLQRKDRPMLTLDHIGQAIRKVIGGIRQNMPSIKIDPIDDGADKDTADVLEDLTRQIEQSSNARSAYLTAANMQVKMGFGVWRVNTVATKHDTFEQDITIEAVKNPFTYYFDPDAVKPQKQDGRFMIVSETMDTKVFEAKFGIKVPLPGSIPNKGIGETRERWFSSESVRIGEYFIKRKIKKKVTQLSNGVVVNSDEITEKDITLYQEQGISPVKEREMESEVIDWYRLTAFEILEHQEWPSKFFPGIPIYGEEENIEGETNVRGIVRAAKDPQRMYNYWNSAAAETIALQPKAPFLVTHDQIKNYKSFWERANTDNLPYLPYEPDGIAPPPQRMQPPTVQSGLLQQAQVSAVDIQQATGVFEASTGDLPQQRSGKAVLALQAEADIGSSLFMDNLAGGIEHCGRVILDLIPRYYDTERVIRLRGEDDAVRFVEINKPILTPDGMQIQNDLTRGKYDVRVGVGPSFRTRRIEAASSMVELAQVFPRVLEIAGDLVVKNLDWPGADEMAERLRKLLPPGIADDEGDEPTPEEQQAAQQQQAQQQAEQEAKVGNLQADTANKKATAVKNLTEAQQNDFENSVQLAELAKAAGRPDLMSRALEQAIALMGDGGTPEVQPQQPTVGLAAG
ncbi:MAG: portal protein [Nitrosomonadaceae bacterium]